MSGRLAELIAIDLVAKTEVQAAGLHFEAARERVKRANAARDTTLTAVNAEIEEMYRRAAGAVTE